jgi:hypothetical protein
MDGVVRWVWQGDVVGNHLDTLANVVGNLDSIDEDFWTAQNSLNFTFRVPYDG